MPIEQKFVKCYFFRLKQIDYQTKESVFCDTLHKDLLNFDKDLKKTKIKVNGDFLKIYKINFDEKTELLELQVLRLRENNIPGIDDEEAGVFKVMELEDGKTIAESTTIIYDYKNACLVMHNNNFGITSKMLGEYLSLLVEKFKIKNVLFECEVILVETKTNKFFNNDKIKFRRLEIGFDANSYKKDETLNNLINNFGQYNSKKVKIILSMGNTKKDNTLDKDEIEKMLNSVASYPEEWDTFRLGYKYQNDKNIEVVDLIENKMISGSYFTYDKMTPITHNRIFDFFEKDYLLKYRDKKPVKL